MSKYINRFSASLVLTLALIAGACSDKKADTLAEDTSLNRDLQMANQDTSAQPALQDVPATVEPGTSGPVASAPTTSPSRPRSSGTTTTRTPPRTTKPSTPAPAPAPTTTASGNTVTKGSGGSERAVGTIPAGAEISLSSNSRVCTNTHKVGQRFSATVSNTVTGSNGATIPAGATATVEITQLDRSENANDPIHMGFRVVSVTFGGRTYAVDATTTYANVDRIRNQPKSKDVQKVVGGAAVGAIIGQVLGKDTKSTVIGAATGAAAGAGAAAATANYEGCVPTGGRITITLDNAATVQA
ncbi:MAG TPA: hypothetical protein VJL35_01785 [Gemmatimonadaceae bacterium]|jgi:hypothetical protein|nr:hypothetical protein [Gemmatimonadaceae bacterium]